MEGPWRLSVALLLLLAMAAIYATGTRSAHIRKQYPATTQRFLPFKIIYCCTFQAFARPSIAHPVLRVCAMCATIFTMCVSPCHLVHFLTCRPASSKFVCTAQELVHIAEAQHSPTYGASLINALPTELVPAALTWQSLKHSNLHPVPLSPLSLCEPFRALQKAHLQLNKLRVTSRKRISVGDLVPQVSLPAVMCSGDCVPTPARTSPCSGRAAVPESIACPRADTTPSVAPSQSASLSTGGTAECLMSATHQKVSSTIPPASARISGAMAANGTLGVKRTTAGTVT